MSHYKVLSLALATILISFALSGSSQSNFRTGQSLGTGGDPEVVATGDVNNDGRTDIVTATTFYFNPTFDYKIRVYLQDSMGTFPTTDVYDYPTNYPGLSSLTIADVNNDSLNDMIIGFDDSIGIYYQNSAGTFGAIEKHYSGQHVEDVRTGDFNNDGLTDLVVCHWNASYIRVFYQAESGFTTKIFTKPAAGYDEIEVGDVNNDGLDDVVFMAGQLAGGIHVFIQKNGNFNNYVSYSPPDDGGFNSLNGIAIGDLNNDGLNDVVATGGGNSPDARIVIWYQNSNTHLLQAGAVLKAYDIPSAVEVADFNCDGKQEIVISHGGWDAISVFHQNNSGKYDSAYELYHISVAQHPAPQSLCTTDINNDGRPDIITTANGPEVELMYNTYIPAVLSTIDSFYSVDSFYSDSSNYQYGFEDYRLDTVPGYVTFTSTYYSVNRYYYVDSIRYDSSYVRTGLSCSLPYQDTLVHSYYEGFTRFYSDTTIVEQLIDTVEVLGIGADLITGIHVSVFPNPSSGLVHINMTIPAGTGDLSLCLYNAMGQLVDTKNYRPLPALIYTAPANIPDGNYLLSIASEKGRALKKIAIQH